MFDIVIELFNRICFKHGYRNYIRLAENVTRSNLSYFNTPPLIMNRDYTVKPCFKIEIIKMKKRQGDLSYNVIFLHVTRFVILLHCC